MRQFALDRPIACIVDADPARKEKVAKKPRWKSCFPFQLRRDDAKFEYRAISGVVTMAQALAILFLKWRYGREIEGDDATPTATPTQNSKE